MRTETSQDRRCPGQKVCKDTSMQQTAHEIHVLPYIIADLGHNTVLLGAAQRRTTAIPFKEF